MAERPDSVRTDLDSLFTRAQTGDGAAWEELVRRSWPKIVRVVRRKLNAPMRALYDSTDFANEVFKSLVAKSDQFDFPTFEALTAYLVQAARQKVVDEHRRQHRLRRDLRRGIHLGAMSPESGSYDPPGSDPSPSQLAQARETQERILHGTSSQARQVIELKAQDYTNEEAAQKTGLNVRAVQRLLKRVRDALPKREGRP